MYKSLAEAKRVTIHKLHTCWCVHWPMSWPNFGNSHFVLFTTYEGAINWVTEACLPFLSITKRINDGLV